MTSTRGCSDPLAAQGTAPTTPPTDACRTPAGAFARGWMPMESPAVGVATAVQSVFGTLKSERGDWRRNQTREDAGANIVQDITMVQNNRRLRADLYEQRPDKFERHGEPSNAASRGVCSRLTKSTAQYLREVSTASIH